MTAWNPRYVAYAASTGMGPAQRLRQDKAGRGASMTGFIIWIGERWQEWSGGRTAARTAEDHRQFDAWLAETFQCAGQMELEFRP